MFERNGCIGRDISGDDQSVSATQTTNAAVCAAGVQRPESCDDLVARMEKNQPILHSFQSAASTLCEVVQSAGILVRKSGLIQNFHSLSPT